MWGLSGWHICSWAFQLLTGLCLSHDEARFTSGAGLNSYSTCLWYGLRVAAPSDKLKEEQETGSKRILTFYELLPNNLISAGR